MTQILAVFKTIFILTIGSVRLLWYYFDRGCRRLDALIDDLFKDLI